MNLKNKVIIITGASRGLGKELALLLDKEEPKLVLAARNLKDLSNVKKQLKSKSIVVKTDVSKLKDIKRLFKRTKDKFGKVDILVNNAGFNTKKLFYNYTEDELDEMFAVNTKGVILSCREGMKSMKTGGKILIVSSVAGFLSLKYYSIYSATKHALEGFVKGAKKETKKVKFHIFHPFRLKTSFHKNYKVKSPEKHMLDAKDYAEYMIAVMKDDTGESIRLFLRNWIRWIVKMV